MKKYCLVIVVLLIAIGSEAQDFSYINDIDLENKEQVQEAAEAAMECCCYLTAVRYDKKDNQRVIATQYVEKWLGATIPQEIALQNIFEEDIALKHMYLVYYAMTYLNKKGQAEAHDLQVAALEAVVRYCSNSSNKLKMNKELKGISKLIETGELEQSIANSTLISSIE